MHVRDVVHPPRTFAAGRLHCMRMRFETAIDTTNIDFTIVKLSPIYVIRKVSHR